MVIVKSSLRFGEGKHERVNNFNGQFSWVSLRSITFNGKSCNTMGDWCCSFTGFPSENLFANLVIFERHIPVNAFINISCKPAQDVKNALAEFHDLMIYDLTGFSFVRRRSIDGYWTLPSDLNAVKI